MKVKGSFYPNVNLKNSQFEVVSDILLHSQAIPTARCHKSEAHIGPHGGLQVCKRPSLMNRLCGMTLLLKRSGIISVEACEIAMECCGLRFYIDFLFFPVKFLMSKTLGSALNARTTSVPRKLWLCGATQTTSSYTSRGKPIRMLVIVMTKSVIQVDIKTWSPGRLVSCVFDRTHLLFLTIVKSHSLLIC